MCFWVTPAHCGPIRGEKGAVVTAGFLTDAESIRDEAPGAIQVDQTYRTITGMLHDVLSNRQHDPGRREEQERAVRELLRSGARRG